MSKRQESPFDVARVGLDAALRDGAWRVLPLGPEGLAWAQSTVTAHHYLRKPVDPRCMPEAFGVHRYGSTEPLGCFIVGRPQATRCRGFYGSIADVAGGWAEVTRWQVLNLARIWLSPLAQPGGALHSPDFLPGFVDRRGRFRSTLLSELLIPALLDRVRSEYLVRRPPCFLEEPYELAWMLSYSDPERHRGTVYAASGFEMFPVQGASKVTWRHRLEPLCPIDDARVRKAAAGHPRSIQQRERRALAAAAGAPA